MKNHLLGLLFLLAIGLSWDMHLWEVRGFGIGFAIFLFVILALFNRHMDKEIDAHLVQRIP